MDNRDRIRIYSEDFTTKKLGKAAVERTARTGLERHHSHAIRNFLNKEFQNKEKDRSRANHPTYLEIPTDPALAPRRNSQNFSQCFGHTVQEIPNGSGPPTRSLFRCELVEVRLQIRHQCRLGTLES
jgi:hypothetical protein